MGGVYLEGKIVDPPPGGFEQPDEHFSIDSCCWRVRGEKQSTAKTERSLRLLRNGVGHRGQQHIGNQTQPVNQTIVGGSYEIPLKSGPFHQIVIFDALIMYEI